MKVDDDTDFDTPDALDLASEFTEQEVEPTVAEVKKKVNPKLKIV